MRKRLAELEAHSAAQAAQIEALQTKLEGLIGENQTLRQKVQFLMQRLFGRKTEKINPAQLELLLGLVAAAAAPDGRDDEPPPSPSHPRRRREQPERLPEDLPVEEQIVDPEPVRQDPSAYQCIGQEVTEELDVVPTRYFRRRIVRRKFVSKADRTRPPLIAPLAPRLIEGGYASAGLVTDIVLKKYVDHLPLNRQEQILRTRHGISLSRQTMSDWMRIAADWLKPIYRHIREDLRQRAYLQVDETPVRYGRREGGGSGQGYFWLYHHPGGEVLYEWHTSRAAHCLDEMLKEFRGTLQCDGYSAYGRFVKEREGIRLAGCWAHARRKFHDAREECPTQAGWVLNQIGCLYRVERAVRGAGPALRQAVRGASSAMVLARLHKMLRLKLTQHRPTSAMGKAITYTLALWTQLLRYLDDGRLEIDNNLVENAVRPTALGKKNWLFIGHPEAGERSAILYTLLENCKRLGINPRDYLYDVLSRLPAMTNQQTASLTPAQWLDSRSKSRAA